MPRRRRRKRASGPRPKYQKNRRYAKGVLFEALAKEVVKGAGFIEDEASGQLTATKRRLHGRGATHQADVVSRFELGIPFVHPLLLIGEAKWYARPIHIQEIREFLGLYTDITQYHHIDTRKAWRSRYRDMLRPRYTYCPVFFSMGGFDKRALGLMFAHGIFPVSYEDNQPMGRIARLATTVLNRIKFSKLGTKDFVPFRSVEGLDSLREELRKEGYADAVRRLRDGISGLRSYIGVLDQKLPISILSFRKSVPRHPADVELKLVGGSCIQIRSTRNREYGQFSITRHFLRSYLSDESLRETAFRQIDVVVKDEDGLRLVQLRPSAASRASILSAAVIQPGRT